MGEGRFSAEAVSGKAAVGCAAWEGPAPPPVAVVEVLGGEALRGRWDETVQGLAFGEGVSATERLKALDFIAKAGGYFEGAGRMCGDVAIIDDL